MRFLPQPAKELTSTLVLNAGGVSNLYTDFRPLLDDHSVCEWAFAGCKEYFADGKCTWSHEVDSRVVEEGVSPAPDVGHCRRLPNGDELETGEMVNPDTGDLCAYEEVWRDEDVAPGANVVALKLKDGSSVRGIFVQVGDLAQAIVQHPRGVSARRWHFLDSWRTVASFGEDSDRIPLLDGSADTDSAALESPAWETVESYSWKA